MGIASYIALVFRTQRELTSQSQYDICRESGLNYRYYQKIEAAKSNLSIETFSRIAEKLGVPAFRLLLAPLVQPLENVKIDASASGGGFQVETDGEGFLTTIDGKLRSAIGIPEFRGRSEKKGWEYISDRQVAEYIASQFQFLKKTGQETGVIFLPVLILGEVKRLARVIWRSQVGDKGSVEKVHFTVHLY